MLENAYKNKRHFFLNIAVHFWSICHVISGISISIKISLLQMLLRKID